MKNLYVLVVTFLFLCSCSKDEGQSCELVVNAHGPAFIQVTNHYSETVLVYFGDFNLPFGAELRSGTCELYGVPVNEKYLEISTLDGKKSRDVRVKTIRGETVVVEVAGDFFR
ncbi:MAG: hypothetical protein IPM92_05010 [Saprospiraceae bacterium]|nr:hypothetical protein [Saprospiraceae bacterium]